MFYSGSPSILLALCLVLSSWQIKNVSAQTQALSVRSNELDDSKKLTTGVENYILLIKRQNADMISNFDNSLASFRQNFANEVSIMDVQSVMLEKRMKEVTATLNPLDVLDPQSRLCVQKYRGNIATVESVRNSLTACAAASSASLASLVANAEVTRRNLNNYYISNFETMLSNCNKTYPMDKALANYTTCVEQTIATVNGVTFANQKAFDSQIVAANCAAESKIRESLDCSFSIYYTTISAIGEATRLINNCKAGLENCPVCESNQRNDGACTQSLLISPVDAAVNNINITNPFRSFNNARCVQLQISA